MIRTEMNSEPDRSINGSITVFLSLILTCICALMGGLFESARVAGSGWYMQMALNSSIDSLMSCYHREIWDQYRIFVLECSDKKRLADEMNPQMVKYLEAAPFYSLNDGKVQIESMEAITGLNGDFFAAEVVDYMKTGVWALQDVSGLPDTAKQIKEAKSVHKIAEGYQENGRKMFRLEEAIEAIGTCLKRQEEYLDNMEDAAKDADGRDFFKAADNLKKELKRIPDLVAEYEKQADRLAKELETSEKGAYEVKSDLEETNWDMIQKEMDGYRSYLDTDGARRNEIKNTENIARDNETVVDEAIRKGEEIQKYIDEWEADDEDDELDEEALWSKVLPVTARFKRDTRFKNPSIKDKKKMNVLETVSRLSGKDMLSICVPDGIDISNSKISNSTFPSVLYGDGKNDGSGSANILAVGLEKALLDEYAAHFFTRFGQEANGNVHYEQEYLLQGKTSDRENLKQTVNELLAVREAMNLASLYADSQKRSEAEALALAITGITGLAPITTAATFFIMTVWAFAESVADVRTLLSGGKIPLFKQPGEWKISLSALTESGTSIFKNGEGHMQFENGDSGIDYQDWLKLLFLVREKGRFCYRMMDMIQNHISEKEPGFRMDQCQYGVCATYEAQGSLIKLKRTSRKEY